MKYVNNFITLILIISGVGLTACQSGAENISRRAQFTFASKDSLYARNKVPGLEKMNKKWHTQAWKGEKVHTQLLVWSTEPLKEVKLKVHTLESADGEKISDKSISANFIGYVLADIMPEEWPRCQVKPGLDSTLVADVIDIVEVKDIPANTTQPVWLSVEIPRNAAPGIYEGTVELIMGEDISVGNLNFSVEVIDRALPDPEEWAFHLDLWQNPDAIARMHDVEKWSDEHFEVMRPYMQMLADAGQKVITTTLIHDPWNSQTYDVYSSMIKWTKKKDGSWEYDYSIFDKWVSFMLSFGVDKYIECYSMIPWNLKFYYFDESLGKDTLIVAEPGSAAYNNHWEPMLADFARHLKEKGWFEKTTIAMDERPMEAMQKAIAVIKNADKDFQISLAGNYHPEIEAYLTDYCVASHQVINEETMAERKRKGMTTTFYTCCVEEYPNTFTVSPPAEATWLGWHAAHKGYDGYLRWAYNSWPEQPMKDSRFGRWASGDTYLVYPGPRSSIRFERLIEGIEDFEKIRILKEEFAKNNQQQPMDKLERVLANFELEALTKKDAAEMVNRAQSTLNNF